MAILNNLVVHGASRFLNTAYFTDISVSGTASLASLSATGDITAGGNLYSTTGNLYLKNLLAINGQSDNWLRINANNAFTGGTYFGSSIVRTDGTLQVGSSGAYLKSNSTNTTIANLVAPIATITTGAITTLTASDVNANNVSVANNLHATHFDLQTVAQLGGSFYVSPTVKFPNSGTTLGVAKSGTTLTLTITDSSITSTTMAGIVWSANSRVKVSGTINGVVTGTMDGTVSSINTSSHVLTLSVSGENSGSVVAGTYSASQFSDLSVMVYQRRVVDGSTNNDYRVGIWMNCYDLVNSSATIRVYGGTSSAPNVLLGNLTNAGLGTVNGITPSGWGLYAQNAFLWGTIVSTEGQIGGWTIGDTKLFNNTDSMTSTSAGIYLGTNGIRNYKDANTYVNITGGVITAKAVDLTGKITATSGKIGKYNITTSYLDTYQDTSNPTAATNAGFGGNQAFWAGNNSSNSAPFRVSYGGALVATSATITGAITATSGYIGASNATNKITIGTDSTNASIYYGMSTLANTSSNGFYIGTDGIALGKGVFKVTNAGALTATSATITGAITATSGTIGASNASQKITIGTNASYASIYYGMSSLANTSSNGFYIGTDGIALGKGAFKVTAAGALTATSATITGVVNADTGSFGGSSGFTIASGKMYSSTHSAYNTAVAGVYIGTDYISLGSGGVTYFKNDGTGKIGPWTLSTAYIRNGNIASATNTTVAGVYLGTDGLNISNGTVATTSYITKSAVNIGNKLTWNGTTLSVTGNINATSGEIGKWAIGEDMLMGMSTIQIPGSTSVIKNRTYLYSGEMNYGTLTATKNADGGTMYITPTTGNVSVCAKFSTRPVHPDSAGQYSNTYWVAPSVQVTGYTGYISIKYTFDYLGGETGGGTGTIFQRENITSTSQTTVYSLIQMKNANDIIRNIDTLITFETPGANNQITVRCPIYTLSHSTIYFYEQAVEAFYGDNFTAISIQREDTNGDVSETFKIDQSGYVYASDIQLNGDITNGNGVSLNELSVRGTVQSASKSVAISSSNTIGATPAIGAQLTLTPGTYLLWGRFVFSTAGSGTARNNRIAFYTGASPTDSTMLIESQVCVFTAARNWGALTTTYIVSPTANTTYTVGGTSSLPGPDGGMSVIKAIRLL